MFHSTLGKFMFALFCLVVLSLPICAQTKNDSDSSALRQLTDEVRSLRQVLERTSAYSYRGQLIIDRIRMKQDRMDKLSTALEDTKNELNQLELQNPSLDERVKDLTEMLEKTPTADRGPLEGELKVAKQAVTFQKQRQDELRDRESHLMQSLHDEETNLQDLERKLTALETELERASGGIKPE
jgi:chromosome segregation ATPase